MKRIYQWCIVVLMLLIATDKMYAQQGAGILGVDHVGINVPDMSKAIAFFSGVLGFTPVTQIGPIELDSSWKTTSRMQQGTGAVTIKMVHAGTGASLELFAYDHNKGSQRQPGGDDLGATHLAFYTENIQAAVAYLKSKGVKVLGDIFLTPVGDTKGESWVYFETPWGSKLELVSYPHGKGYEAAHPKTILWSPKTNLQNTPTHAVMTTNEIQSLVAQHLAVWNERDENKRKEIAVKAYAADITMVDRHFTAIGFEKIAAFVNDLQQKNPGFRFTPARPIDAHTNIARLFWQFGSAEKPNAVTGMDLFVMEDGKVSKLYVFVDEMK